MRPLSLLLLSRLTAVWLLVWGCTATAATGWNGAEPGVTRTQELLERFGKPARRTRKGGQFLLDYRGKALPRDTRAVRFYVDAEQDVLRRIDVFPKKPLTRSGLEEDFGPACADAPRPESPCYEARATADNQLAFAYPALGLEARFLRGRVMALTYQEPLRPSAAPAAKPEPEEDTPSRAPEPPAPAPVAAADDDLTMKRPTVVPEAAPAEPRTPVAADDDFSLKRPTMVSDAAPAEDSPKRATGTTSSADPDPTALPSRVTITDAEETTPAPVQEREPPAHDILSLGGIYYQRAELSGSRLLQATTLNPSVPSLVDLFVDVKPSESVRSFVRGRLLFDPLDPNLSKPQVLLDQLWIKFALADRVFITAGRQQIKWGSSRVWNPTDFLRQPNPLPLDVFDLRTGVDMVKVNIPWEEMASNLWLVATADLNGPPEQRIRYGGAARAEVTLGPSELSATAAFQQGRRPRYGLDWNIGLGIFDFNAEVALVHDSPVKLWEETAEGFTQRPVVGPKVLASVGAQSTFRFEPDPTVAELPNTGLSLLRTGVSVRIRM